MAKAYRGLLGSLEDYKAHIITGVASFLVGGAIFSSCGRRDSVEKIDLPPYPTSVQIYNMSDYGENPVARATMSDGRTELLSADNQEGTSFRSVRTLEELDLQNKKNDWRSRRVDIETRIESERAKRTKEAQAKPKSN
ncbi:MAG: hypothetical protein PHF67_01240 [Candidatus Nanoarchaeia archaeon]|nr:hypothetical protein [Candidatus Nanoarchaeia archaeon]